MYNPLNDLQPVEALATHSPYGDVTGTEYRTPGGVRVYLFAGPDHTVLSRYRDDASDLELWVQMTGVPAYVRGSDAHLTESYLAHLLQGAPREVGRTFVRRADAA